ncbi:MAG: WD40 repeat domain-containing protein [Polyangia bacterium]
MALALKKDIAASWSIGPSEPAIKTWDLRALGGRTVLREHQGHNPSVQIDRNGALAASTAVSNEGWSLRVWNLGTGVLAAHLDGGRGALCVSGDCRSALSWGTRGLLAWNTITGAATVLEGDKGGPIAFALSYDGRRALTSTDGGKLLCWEVPERRFRVLASRDVNRVAISPDGTIGACLSKQGWLCAWNLDTLEVVGRIEVPFDGSLTLGGGGELAMVEAFSETAVCNLGSGALDRLQEPHLASTALSANAGLAAIGFGVRLRLWGCRERKVLCEIPVLSPHPEYPTNAVYRLQVSDDGKYVASLSEDRALRVFDTSGRELAIFTSESRFFAVDIAWAKRRIVAIDFLGRIHYLSLENCPPVGRPRS